MRCFIDMDGILTDFHGAMLEHFNTPDNLKFEAGSWETVDTLCRNLKISHNKFWQSLSHKFWGNMPWTKDGKVIWDFLTDEFGSENCYILSSPSDECSAHGKILWLKENLPRLYRERRFFLGSHKYQLASHNSILIDDRDKNIDEFIQYGGKGILYPRFWNSRHHIHDTDFWDIFTKEVHNVRKCS